MGRLVSISTYLTARLRAQSVPGDGMPHGVVLRCLGGRICAFTPLVWNHSLNLRDTERVHVAVGCILEASSIVLWEPSEP